MMSRQCARWSARPSATSVLPRLRRRSIRRWIPRSPRCVVDDLAASTHAIGELMLEVVLAYLSDTDAADVLALLCEQIGEPLENGLAARGHALFGDRRALHGTAL
ncbi:MULTISPECIES: hypothetical protein [Streptomyces]|uniref:Uncharacterized protein n=1 Tax=Streptomyces milbemycinicus TaxID=476552 RepID=A0ABW8M4Q7_9ACTN